MPISLITANSQGGAPAFSAYLGTNQTISANTWTKVQCNIEEFDTNSNYDNATNYRFTPTVAGYYQISGGLAMTAGSTTLIFAIYKNGSEFKRLQYSTSGVSISGSYPIYFNGSTDYVEIYVYSNNTTINSGNFLTYFGGSFVRSA